MTDTGLLRNNDDKFYTNIDIATVPSLPKNIDLLVGGFPCQDYSVAKTLSAAKGLKGKKGVLWWEILRLVQLQKPKFVLLYSFFQINLI